MSPSYDNLVTDQEVSLAIERFFISDYPGTWSPSRINTDAPPTGFSDLGSVVEDSPAVTVTRSKFQLVTGIPAVLQYEAIVGLAGQISFGLHSMDARKVGKALGTVEAVNVLRDAIGTDATTVSSVTDRATITLEGSPATPLQVGARVLTAASSTVAFHGDNESYISSISGPNITVFPVWPTSPVAGDYFSEIGGIRVVLGTVKRLEYHLLGVADFIDGVQVVHEFKRVTPAGDWSENISPGANVQIPVSFDTRGYVSSVYTADKQLIVGERWYFPSIGSL